MTITDIVANIDQRLAALDSELTHLTGARAALVNQPSAQVPVKPRRARRTAPQRRYDVVPAGKLVAMLADSDGLRTSELSQATNGAPAQVLALLKEQEDAGQVRRSGTRASTRWHAITDQDRIAARVAELEASSRQSRARKS